MPLPKPSKDESKDKFISRCMVFQDKEGKFNLKDKKEREQALAICYSQYKSKNEEQEVSFENILREDT